MQPTWHIERLLLRTDGFASLSAPLAGGEMLTKPLTFSGTALEINYRTAAAGKPQADPGTLAGKPVRLREILADICTRMKELVAPASWTKCGRWKPMSGPGCR